MNRAKTVIDETNTVAALFGLTELLFGFASSSETLINLSLQPSSIQVLHETVFT